MTCDELKVKLDDLLGMESVVRASDYEAQLHYFSPTGILLFAILLLSTAPSECRVGGCSGGVLPDMWETLMRLHRTPEKEDNDD